MNLNHRLKFGLLNHLLKAFNCWPQQFLRAYLYYIIQMITGQLVPKTCPYKRLVWPDCQPVSKAFNARRSGKPGRAPILVQHKAPAALA